LATLVLRHEEDYTDESRSGHCVCTDAGGCTALRGVGVPARERPTSANQTGRRIRDGKVTMKAQVKKSPTQE
jgi:hypothetical protein